MRRVKVSAVYDTGIFLQAIISGRGHTAAAIRLFEQGLITLYVSQELLDELRDVLTRSSVRRKNPHYTDQDIEDLFYRIETRATKIAALPHHFTYEPETDPVANG